MTHDERLARAREYAVFVDVGKVATMAGITIEDAPQELPPRPGYKWQPYLVDGSTVIAWEEVEDPDADGTAEKPIDWLPGMCVQANYYYLADGVRYVCIKTGEPNAITEEYFEQF